ncbi:hypothetical protein HPP92_002501 [Vanilla planifolia]|uniref:Uncharacterized protein n=1 Tax=Vanilla planifolia TaxID=51239 RepID=A0A835RSP5_VANPL|nr:hypothetical protein HPP92_002501 [Vanilla planifolia]
MSAFRFLLSQFGSLFLLGFVLFFFGSDEKGKGFSSLLSKRSPSASTLFSFCLLFPPFSPFFRSLYRLGLGSSCFHGLHTISATLLFPPQDRPLPSYSSSSSSSSPYSFT